MFPQYIINALQYLKPPEQLTVSEWAEKYRILDERSSAMPGPWRNEITPYLNGIMDEFNNYLTEEIVFVKPTQVGGTECLQNILGYCAAQAPAPTLILYPTEDMAEWTSENRLEPMIMASPVLRKRYKAKESQKLELKFDAMYVALVGSNSPSSLASRPICYLLMDEVDKYPGASKKEADPISLAKERTKTFVSSRKIFSASTPTIRTGNIWRMKEKCDSEKHFFVPCPHCEEMIELKFAQLKYPDDSTGLDHKERAEMALYICQNCGATINDAMKISMLRHGEWRSVRGDSKAPKSVAFWLNTLYSPFTSFADIVKNYLDSKDDPELLQNFTNSWLAEPWESTKSKTSAQLVLDHQTEIPEFVVPDWCELLTGGIDVQENSLYWTIRAWGKYMTSQNIAHGQALSLQDIVNVMNMEYKLESGGTMLVDLALIDSGDQTDDVYDFCAGNTDWILPCKGASKSLMSHFRISSINKADSKAYGMQLVMVDGSKYKDMIAGRLQKEKESKGAWNVYKGCDIDYAEQITSEHRVTERGKNGQEISRWEKKTTHADNHYLDAEVYCAAAADILGVRSLFLKNDESKAEKREPQKQSADVRPEEENWISKNDTWV